MNPKGIERKSSGERKVERQIAMSDNNPEISPRERAAIECLSPFVANMPQSRVDDLLEDIKEALQNRETSEIVIRDICKTKAHELNIDVREKGQQPLGIRIVRDKDSKMFRDATENVRVDFDRLMQGKQSLDTFSIEQIAGVLSYVHVHSHEDIPFSGERNPAARDFIKNLSDRDIPGIIRIAENWETIARKLQIDAKDVQPLVNDLIREFGESIDASIGTYLDAHHVSPEKKDQAKRKIREVVRTSWSQGNWAFNYIYNQVAEIIEHASGEKIDTNNHMIFVDRILRREYAHTTMRITTSEKKYDDIENIACISDISERKRLATKYRAQYRDDPAALRRIEDIEHLQSWQGFIDSNKWSTIGKISDPSDKVKNDPKIAEMITATAHIAFKEAKNNASNETNAVFYSGVQSYINTSERLGGSERIKELKSKDPNELTKEEKRLLAHHDRILRDVKREYVKAELGIDDAELARRGIDPDKIDLSKPIHTQTQEASSISNQTTPGSQIPFHDIDRGIPYIFPLENNNPESPQITIRSKDEYFYTVSIGADDSINIPKDSTEEYLSGLRFFRDVGLDPVIQSMGQQNFARMIGHSSPSDRSIVINMRDGLDEDEKMFLLKKFGALFEIPEIDKIIDAKEGIIHMRSFFFTRSTSVSKILQDKKLMDLDSGRIHSTELSTALRGTPEK